MSGVEVEICGIKVNFPFQPYSVQVDYMRSVLTCLNERRHGVLESPTGTGKTLSLLCSSLAWLQHEKIRRRNDANSKCQISGAEAHEEVGWTTSTPRIIYASRTHSQLKQVIEQYKKTAYRHLFHATILGSRDQMCINMGVQKESSLPAKNVLCNVLVKKRSCRFYNNVKNFTAMPNFDPIDEAEKALKNLQMSVIDTTSCCPYFAGKEWVPRSDLIFMPYNYLFDFQMQKGFKLPLSGCIIIVDEGHNISKVCEESASVTISTIDVALCLENVTEEMQHYYEEAMMGAEEKEYTSDDLVVLHQTLTKLEQIFDSFTAGTTGIVHSGSHTFNILAKADLTFENYHDLSNTMQKVGENIMAKAQSSVGTKGMPLKKLGDNLLLIFGSADGSGGLERVDKNFKLYLDEFTPQGRNRNNKVAKRMNYWCFNPSFTLKQVLQYDVRSVILTSGTLSPLEATVKELGLMDPVTLENNHIINSKQILVTTIAKGPSNFDLKCTYQTRSIESYWRELGMTIENLTRQIPDGLLVFFPSYSAMAKAKGSWEEMGMLKRLGLIKTVLYEPFDKSEMAQVLRLYASEIEERKGAILFAVLRGKISEGLDFSGKFARGVIITGIPYAPFVDPKVQQKKDFINNNQDIFQGLTGDSWYQMDAMRAVNQAMGRVIRHVDDYGAIILCDSRFATSGNKLPKWLRSKHFESPTFGRAVVNIRQFYKDAKQYIDLKMSEASNQVSEVPSTSSSSSTNDRNDRYKSKINEATFQSNEPLSTVVKNAEAVLNLPLLVNPAVLETKISAYSNINVQPAKRRKIKITHASDFPLPSGPQSTVDFSKFLLDVKLGLEPDSYATFAFIIRKYKITKNYEEALSSFEKLFLGGENKFPEMFKDCQIIFADDHLQKFQEYLKTKEEL